MKKINKSTLWIISGILFLIAAVLSDDVFYMYAGIGFSFFAIGFAQKKRESDSGSKLEKENSK